MARVRGPVAHFIAAVLLLAAWSDGAPALTLRFPDEGLQFSELAGELGGFSWSAGKIAVRGQLEPAGAGVRGLLEIDSTGLAFHDVGFRRAAENLHVEGTVELVDMTDAVTVVRIDLLVSSGGVLVDQFYVDLGTFPIAVSGRVELPQVGSAHDPEWVTITDAEIAMAGVGAATGEARLALDGSGIELDGNFAVPGLARIYDLLAIKPTEQRRYRIETKGETTARFSYRSDSSGDFTLTGAIRLRDAGVSASDPEFRLSGIDVDLPISIGTGQLAMTSARGSAAFDQGTILGGPVGATTLAIEVGRNSIRLVAPVRVPLFGGAMTIRSFESTELAFPKRRMSLAVDLAEIDLGKLSRGLGIPRVAGTMSASVPEIEIGSGKLRSQGELSADVFGGAIKARNLRGDSLLSTVPTFGFDLDFEGISLAELTRTLSFGYVSGIAKGAVRDLEFVSWGPVEFSAWLETYPVSGVSQRVSVDAIRQISIVGGGSADPISESIMGFFDEYRYEKLGFRCRLHNDVFELDGIEVRGGDHYLVVGAAVPPRVNVISHVRRISFSDMISRIESATY